MIRAFKSVRFWLAVVAGACLGASPAQETSGRKTIARVDFDRAQPDKIQEGRAKVGKDADGRPCLEMTLDYGVEDRMMAGNVTFQLPKGMSYTIGPKLYLEFEIYFEGPKEPALMLHVGGGDNDKNNRWSFVYVEGLKPRQWQKRTINLSSLTLKPYNGLEKQFPKDGESFDDVTLNVDRGRTRGIQKLQFRDFHFYEEDKLAANPDVNARDEAGQTRLHKAATSGDKVETARLLERGAEVNAKDKEGNTPLHLAAKGGHAEVVALLIAKKADVDAEGRQGWKALHFAAYDGHIDAVRLLLEAGANKYSIVWDKMTPMFWAIRQGQKKVVEVLLDRGVDLEAETCGMRPLHLAARGWTQGTHTEIVKMLLDRGAKTDIFVAATLGDTKQVDTFLKADPSLANAKINGGWTPLHDAARLGRLEVAVLLIDHKAEVNAKAGKSSAYGTPLHQAAMFLSSEVAVNQLKVAKFLLEHGADPNAPDRRGFTPLHYSKGGAYPAMVDLLLKNGAQDKPPVPPKE